MITKQESCTKSIVCKKCFYNNEIYDFDQKICKQCGFVLQEDNFDKGPDFVDTKLTGQIYSLSTNMVDQTKAASEYISEMIRNLKLNSEYPQYLDKIGETPLRIMKFAYCGTFLSQGTNIQNYAAAALYIALRFNKAPFLLMDFSDKLCINLYKLARCYRKLAKYLNKTLRLNEKLPAIDPSIYIPRFCKMLDFEDKTEQVRETAMKLLKRMKLDWMAHGRRPSSLCGAAILIASRMHGFKKNTSEVCKIVYVCEETLRKRLEEFKDTAVAKLTSQKFQEIDVEKIGSEQDPPAFKRNQKELQNKKLPAAISNVHKDSQSALSLSEQDNQEAELKQLENQFFQSVKDFEQIEIKNLDGNIYLPPLEEKNIQENANRLANNQDASQIKNGINQEKNRQVIEVQSEKKQEEIKKIEQNPQSNEISTINSQLELFNKKLDQLTVAEQQQQINCKEELSSLSESDTDQFFLSKDESTVKTIIWYQMNEVWLKEQMVKDPKQVDKKDCKKRNKRRNDQLLNEDNPVEALMKSKKCKSLDQEKLRKTFVQNLRENKITRKDIFQEEEPANEPLPELKQFKLTWQNLPNQDKNVLLDNNNNDHNNFEYNYEIDNEDVPQKNNQKK